VAVALHGREDGALGAFLHIFPQRLPTLQDLFHLSTLFLYFGEVSFAFAVAEGDLSVEEGVSNLLSPGRQLVPHLLAQHHTAVVQQVHALVLLGKTLLVLHLGVLLFEKFAVKRPFIQGRLYQPSHQLLLKRIVIAVRV